MDDNPYREPIFTQEPERGFDSGFGPHGIYPSEAELRAFVGKRAGYYLAKWAPTLHHSLPVGGFNWAGFFLNGLWLAYRKMYRALFILFGIVAAETLFEEFAVAGGFAKEDTLTALGRAIALILSVICGKLGNGWYLAHATRQIAAIRALGLPDEAYHHALARRGRPSFLAPLLFLGLAVLFGVAVVIAADFVFAEE